MCSTEKAPSKSLIIYLLSVCQEKSFICHFIWSPHNYMSDPYIKERPSRDHFKIDPNPKKSVYLRRKRQEMDPGMQSEERYVPVVCHSQRGEPLQSSWESALSTYQARTLPESGFLEAGVPRLSLSLLLLFSPPSPHPGDIRGRSSSSKETEKSTYPHSYCVLLTLQQDHAGLEEGLELSIKVRMSHWTSHVYYWN